MKILQRLSVPTGDILVVNGELGKLEMLSIGKYDKHINMKADFLNLYNKLEQVRHVPQLPLTERWIVRISTQYGCNMGCKFCDVPSVGRGKNATFNDIVGQVTTGLKLHPEIKWSNKFNIHMTRMGEPTWNPNVLEAAKWFKQHIDPEYNAYPVISTMMPKNNKQLQTFIHTWMHIKNNLYNGKAGLQLSINSTDESERRHIFNDNAHSIEEISHIMNGIIPKGRKITLNFAVADYTIDPDILLKYFHPDNYIVKLTQMHKTAEATKNGINTFGDYTLYEPYEKYEEKLRNAGYNVIVFVESEEEDSGLVTCGNAILSGSLPRTNYKEILN